MNNRKRDQILQFIDDYHSKHGYAPSYQEIGDGVGLYSKSSVHSHIQRLFEEGKLETDTERMGEPRAMRVAGKYTMERVMMRQLLLNQVAIMAAMTTDNKIVTGKMLDECLKCTADVLNEIKGED